MATSFGVGTLANYNCTEQVGEGTYGYVFKATDLRTREVVALKRLIFHRESTGFPLSAVREIKFLKGLTHKNIVLLKDVITAKGCEDKELQVKTPHPDDAAATAAASSSSSNNEDYANDVLKLCGHLYFVFEYVDHDLGGLIDSKYTFSKVEIKCIMKQLFDALDYLQDKRIVHRDIKTSNILISNYHHVKLADFGLARSLLAFDGREVRLDLSNNVITMWYRPPELLLGAVRYNQAVDMWSAGCVLAELELGRPFLPGKSEIEQLELIFRSIGTPVEQDWPGISSLPNYALAAYIPRYAATLRYSHLPAIGELAMNLLERILVADPQRRSTARVALSNMYFRVDPQPPADPADLPPLNIPAGSSFHEYQTKQQRKQREEEEKLKLLQPQSSEAVANNGPLLPAPAPAPAPLAQPPMQYVGGIPQFPPPPPHPSFQQFSNQSRLPPPAAQKKQQGSGTQSS